MPLDAGKKKADDMPLTAASTVSCPISAAPVISRTATVAWLVAERTFEPDHHEVARQPIGQYPAREQEDDLWQGARGQHEAEIRLRARQVEDGESQCDGRHSRCRGRRRLAR